MRQALLVFAAMVCLDLVFAVYVIKCAERASVEAAAWAAGIQFFNVFIVTSFVKAPRLVLPLMAGAAVGTWLAVEFVK